MNNTTTRNKVWTFCVIYLGYMLLFADRTVFNLALAGIGKDFNMSPAALGAAGSAFFLGYTLMQIPGGYLTDRFGARAVVISTLILWSLLTGFTGLAWSFSALVIIRFLFGVAEGPYPAAALKQVAQNQPKKKRAQLTALLMSSNYAGAAIAPFIIVQVIAASGWRSAFYYLGAFGIILVGLYALSDRKVATVAKKATTHKINWRELDARVWLFVVLGLALNVITKGLETWMPIYFLTSQHLELKKLAWLVPLQTIAGGIAAAISGYLMVHLFKKKEVLMLITACVLTLLFMFGLFRSQSLFWIVSFQILTYFAKSLAFTGIFDFASQVLHDDSYGSAIGIINFGGQLGGFVGPLLIGWIVQLTGSYSAAFLGLVISAVIAVIISFCIKRDQ